MRRSMKLYRHIERHSELQHKPPTQATPYLLVYGVEAVLSLERKIPSLMMVVEEGLTTEENVKLRLHELEALDEKNLEAQQRLQCYQTLMSKSFNKHFYLHSFQVGDLVLAISRPIIVTHRTGNNFLGTVPTSLKRYT